MILKTNQRVRSSKNNVRHCLKLLKKPRLWSIVFKTLRHLVRYKIRKNYSNRVSRAYRGSHVSVGVLRAIKSLVRAMKVLWKVIKLSHFREVEKAATAANSWMKKILVRPSVVMKSRKNQRLLQITDEGKDQLRCTMSIAHTINPIIGRSNQCSRQHIRNPSQSNQTVNLTITLAKQAMVVIESTYRSNLSFISRR